MSTTVVCRYLWLLWSLFGVFSGVLSAPRARNADASEGGGYQTTQNNAIRRLSQLFGIKRIPPNFRHKTPPEYMSALYESVAYDDGITKSPAPYNADVVRGFPDRASREQMHFLFNISYIEAHEQVLEAEFQLFKLRPRTLINSHRRAVHVVQLKLYQVLDHAGVKLLEQRRISAHSHGWEKFRVTDTVHTWLSNHTTNYGFLVEATSLRGEYVNGSHVNFAQRSEHHDSKQPVLVVFTHEDLQAFNEDPFGDDGVDEDDDDDSEGLSAAEMEARRRNYIQFLNEGHRAQYGGGTSTFLQNNYMSPQQHEQLTSETSRRGGGGGRARRDVAEPLDYGRVEHGDAPGARSGGGRVRRSEVDTTDYYEKAANEHAGFKYNHRNSKRKKSCSRDTLYVDFEEIGWSNWIISPKGYNAYHCKGDCPFPLGQNQKPTNHATVQSIVHAMRIRGAGKDLDTPCCVPNKLFSISLLYFDDEENVTLKKYADMVAASCGCQ